MGYSLMICPVAGFIVFTVVVENSAVFFGEVVALVNFILCYLLQKNP
jgi:hypothetical protein